MIAIYILVFVFGLLIGSFLNVVIYRLPRELSIVRPRSSCPSCGHQVAWYQNFPVISYMGLKGKCSSCQTKIGIQYPLVELLVGLFAVLLLSIGMVQILLRRPLKRFSLIEPSPPLFVGLYVIGLFMVFSLA